VHGLHSHGLQEHDAECASGISSLTVAMLLPHVHGSHSHGLQVHAAACTSMISSLTEAMLLPHVHGSHSHGLQVHAAACTLMISSLTGTAVTIMCVIPPVRDRCELVGTLRTAAACASPLASVRCKVSTTSTAFEREAHGTYSPERSVGSMNESIP
jgi:hypothetical protein